MNFIHSGKDKASEEAIIIIERTRLLVQKALYLL